MVRVTLVASISSQQDLSYNNNALFSTLDRDNDGRSSSPSCVQQEGGGWWYKTCTYANLNGRYNTSQGNNIFWHEAMAAYGDRRSLKFTEMKLKRVI